MSIFYSLKFILLSHISPLLSAILWSIWEMTRYVDTYNGLKVPLVLWFAVRFLGSASCSVYIRKIVIFFIQSQRL